MKSSPAPQTKPPVLLVAEGGVPYRVSEEADPFAVWMDLMEAVEGLCPEWPTREPFVMRIGRL